MLHEQKNKIHNKEGVYFITFTTVGWIDVFSRKVYRQILLDSLQYCQRSKGLVLYGWCIMTNHLHLIASAKENNLADILRDFKRHTSKAIIKAIGEEDTESRKEWMLAIFRSTGTYNGNNQDFQFWQQHNKPIEIYSNEVIQQKMDYLHFNPVEAEFVENPEDWLYSSARDYAGIKGLLDIEMLL